MSTEIPAGPDPTERTSMPDEIGPTRLGTPGRRRAAVLRPGISARQGAATLFAILVGYVLVTISALAVRSPLGHDESVYALRSRDLVDGWSHLSGDYWRDYRAPGLPLMLSALGRIVGIHVTTARALVVVLGATIIVVTALLGVCLRSWSVGAIAAGLIAVSSGFVLTTTTLLADTPGAAFSLIGVLVYLVEVDRGRLRYSYVMVPLAAFAATLSRFGAPFMLGAGLLGVAVIGAPDAIRRRDRRMITGSALLALGTAIVVASIVLTDLFTLDGTSPADANRALVDKNEFTLGTGFRDLELVVNPWSGHYFSMWSKAVGLLMLVGLVAALASLFDHRRPWRVVVFGFVAGTLSLFAVVATVGLVVPNYLVLTVPYWASAAAAGWDWIARRLLARMGSRRRMGVRSLLAIAGALVLALLVDTGIEVRNAHHGYDDAYRNIRAASVAAREQLGDSCVLISRYTPQSGYYSHCRIAPYENYDVPEAADAIGMAVDWAVELFDLGVPPDAPVATMLVERSIRQPDLTDVLAHPDLFRQRIFEAGTPGQFRRHVLVELVDPCVADRSCPTFSTD